VRKVGAIAGRELRSLFVSPVAYVVLTLWAAVGAFFFLSSLVQFQEILLQLQQFQMVDRLRELNLNDDLVAPFFGTMWILLIFGIPAITMGLFAADKANRTEELLLTSPVTIWDIVLGKYLAAAAFVALLVALVAFFPGLLFVYGDPEPGKTLAGLLALLLVSLAYAAIGAFASSITSNQIIAFFVGLVILLVFLILSVVAELGSAQGMFGQAGALSGLLRWLATAEHFQRLVEGLVETRDLVYFGVITGSFLLLTKAAVESVRWR
jgi:ABC-2 type transport system permease protein